MLSHKIRYLQIAFNYDLELVRRILPQIAPSERIFIEAGPPFIKREGTTGIQEMRRYWSGHLVADLKTVDGALDEVEMARQAGADAITALGNSPTETLNLFIKHCARLEMLSMIDMLGVPDPLKVLRRLKQPPDIVVLHRGRDEESTRGKVIQYRHVNRIRSKYTVLISAAGGVNRKEARSAIFNGANIVVVNLVQPKDQAKWEGISTEAEVGQVIQQYLDTIA